MLMTQQLRIRNEAGVLKGLGKLNIIIDVRMRPGPQRYSPCPLLQDLRDCKVSKPFIVLCFVSNQFVLFSLAKK